MNILALDDKNKALIQLENVLKEVFPAEMIHSD